MGERKKQYWIEWCQREENDVCMSASVPEEDVDRVKKMTPEQLSEYISENCDDRTFGKEYVHDYLGMVGSIYLFTNEDGRQELAEIDEVTPEQDEPEPDEEAAYVEKGAAEVRVTLSKGRIEVRHGECNSLLAYTDHAFPGSWNKLWNAFEDMGLKRPEELMKMRGY